MIDTVKVTLGGFEKIVPKLVVQHWKSMGWQVVEEKDTQDEQIRKSNKTRNKQKSNGRSRPS